MLWESKEKRRGAMHADQPHLSSILNRNGPPVPDDVDDCELPDLKEPYQAYARASAKPVYTLHCLLGKEGCRSFEYVQKDSNSTFRVSEHGQVITIRFAGTK